MITLRIFLIGLIALVPDFDRGRLSIVLPEAGSAKHVAVLVYSCKQGPCGNAMALRVGGEPPNLILESEDDFGYRELKGVRVKLVDGMEEGELAFVGGRNHHWYDNVMGEVPVRKDEAQDFSWVPLMKRVVPSAGIIDPQVLYSPSVDKVAAILTLRGIEGIAGTLGLVDICGKVKSFTFKESPEATPVWDLKQALADIVVVQIPLKDNKVTLSTKKFNGEESSLSLKAGQEDVYIDVVLGNLPPIVDNCKDAAQGAGHFEHYFPLSLDPEPKAKQLPFVGSAEIDSEVVEPKYLPAIVKYIEGFEPYGPSIFYGEKAASNRPICAQVIFEQ